MKQVSIASLLKAGPIQSPNPGISSTLSALKPPNLGISCDLRPLGVPNSAACGFAIWGKALFNVLQRIKVHQFEMVEAGCDLNLPGTSRKFRSAQESLAISGAGWSCGCLCSSVSASLLSVFCVLCFLLKGHKQKSRAGKQFRLSWQNPSRKKRGE